MADIINAMGYAEWGHKAGGGWGVGEKKSNSRGRKINTHVDDREKMKDIF